MKISIQERNPITLYRVRGSGSDLKPGDRLELIQTHCCATTNLYDVIHCVREGVLEAVWRVQARGRIQ